MEQTAVILRVEIVLFFFVGLWLLHVVTFVIVVAFFKVDLQKKDVPRSSSVLRFRSLG